MIRLLPDRREPHPLWRIMVLPPGRWSDDRQPWEALPMRWRRGVFGVAGGYEFMQARRLVLPDIGQGTFRYHYGRLDGLVYGVDTAGGARDLDQFFVRIQVAAPPTAGQTPVWYTKWLGRVLYQEDMGTPADDHRSGTRIYHCEDLIGKARDWPLSWHGYWFDTLDDGNRCRGHPGFNSRLEDRTLVGNRDTSHTVPPTDDLPDDVQDRAYAHTDGRTGAAFWTDREAIDQAILFGREAGDPLFVLEESPALEGVEAWSVDDGDNVLGLMQKVLRRQRGRGCSFLDWVEPEGPDGNLLLSLRCTPQSVEDIVFMDPLTGSPVTIPGAASLGLVINLDLQGDQRLVDGSYRLGERGQHRVEYLQTPGARIEITVTLSRRDGTLADQWSGPEEANFLSTGPLERVGEAQEHIYHRYRLPEGFRFLSGDGNGGDFQVIAARCVNGAIGLPSSSVLPDTSIATTEIMRDTCLPAEEVGGRGLRRTQTRIWIRVGSDRWLDGRRHDPISVELRENEIWIAKSDWDDGELGGLRYVGDPAEETLRSRYHRDDIALTLTLQLPHRISYESGDRTALRRMILPPDRRYALWLAAANAITDLGDGDLASGFTPVRDTVGEAAPDSLPLRILRDHRSELAFTHALAWSWYGANRQTLRYRLQACPFLPSFESLDENGDVQSIAYAQLGELIQTVSAEGEVNQVGTPVTGIDYDNTTGIGGIETDWSDLDFGGGR